MCVCPILISRQNLLSILQAEGGIIVFPLSNAWETDCFRLNPFQKMPSQNTEFSALFLAMAFICLKFQSFWGWRFLYSVSLDLKIAFLCCRLEVLEWRNLGGQLKYRRVGTKIQSSLVFWMGSLEATRPYLDPFGMKESFSSPSDHALRFYGTASCG